MHNVHRPYDTCHCLANPWVHSGWHFNWLEMRGGCEKEWRQEERGRGERVKIDHHPLPIYFQPSTFTCTGPLVSPPQFWSAIQISWPTGHQCAYIEPFSDDDAIYCHCWFLPNQPPIFDIAGPITLPVLWSTSPPKIIAIGQWTCQQWWVFLVDTAAHWEICFWRVFGDPFYIFPLLWPLWTQIQGSFSLILDGLKDLKALSPKHL